MTNGRFTPSERSWDDVGIGPGGTGHWPVAAGDPPAARAPRANVVVREIVVPNCGGKLPPRTGW